MGNSLIKRVLYFLIPILLLTGFILNLVLGEVNVPGDCLIHCSQVKYRVIIMDIRLPSALTSLLVGYVLGVSGAVMQGILRNPLAEPFTTGIASAAVLGGLLGYLLVLVGKLTGLYTTLAIPLLALIVGLFSSLIVVMLGSRLGVVGLILMGILITLLSYAASMIVMLIIESINPTVSMQPLYLLYGNLSGILWWQFYVMLAAAVPPILVVAFLSRYVDLLMLGDDVAKASGVNPVTVRRRLVALISIPLAVSLAFTGVIGFIGIIAPYTVRQLTGRGSGSIIIPGSGLVGSLILTYSYLASRVMVKGYVVPITAVTGLVGIPVLMWMILKGGFGAST
ncbi:FecCD family ABC transporter permease [Caldivirga maquilingensis]|uniref:Transport system permease protein n=1 Tax=Caldivirga maquilingensis (strain ATCC 700844 / DSM 13496 / JCM 10307 / IC-167) TaxID=397948 RepID=A8MDX7_CALMQ|nr:iron ABC transporter permease [Caldivirga maquilingensis]ABW01983.1 transport system permease protein [Caldivirga maquilingensis IC-167]